jgi:hypothetical protein
MGGRGAHGDLAGGGGAEGLVTRVTFSVDPAFKIKPLPDARPPDLTEGEAVLDGAADLVLSLADLSFAIAVPPAWAGPTELFCVSSGGGRVIFVPSVQVMVSGAQSSSSSSISAQFDWPLLSSE